MRIVPRRAQVAYDGGRREDARARRAQRACAAVIAACLASAAVPAPATAHPGSVSTGAGSGGGEFGGSLESVLLAPPDPRDSAFYTDPAPLESDPGRVIRTEHAPLPTSALGDALGALGSAGSADGAALRSSADRVLYESTDTNGEPVATSGLFIRNDGPVAAAHGRRPLVVLSPGTQGLGDQCAPSKTIPRLLDVQISPGISVGLGYEIGQAHYFLARGFSVFVPDFHGVGAAGEPTYLAKNAMAHATLDAARAAHQVPDSGLAPESKVGLYGHSQGGGASAAAAELQSTYAPELNLVGAAASGPPADLYPLIDTVDGGINAGLIGFIAAGMQAAYPEQADGLEDIFNDAGRKMLERSRTSCVGESLAAFGFADSSAWTKDGRSVGENLRADPELDTTINAQRIGHGTPEVPVAIIQEPNDDIVPAPQVRRLADEWCGKGVDVETFDGVLPPLLPSSAAVHMLANFNPQGADWLDARVSGEPTAPTCGG